MAVTEAAKEVDLLEGYAINLFSCKMWQSEYTTQEQSILMRGSGSLNTIHLFLRFILTREYVWNVEKNCSLWQVLALTGLASCSLRVDWKLTAKYSYPYRESSLGLKQGFVRTIYELWPTWRLVACGLECWAKRKLYLDEAEGHRNNRKQIDLLELL